MDIMDKLIAEIMETEHFIFDKIVGTTNAAEARVLKATLVLDNLGKRNRKESIALHN